MLTIPFHITDWEHIPAITLEGESGTARSRTIQFSDLRIRMVEYSPDYKADHWCTKGHLLFCLEGTMYTELADGSTHELKAGTSYQVTDGMSVHRNVTREGAKLIIIDGGFLKRKKGVWI